MSTKVTTTPTTSPSLRMGYAQYSTGKFFCFSCHGFTGHDPCAQSDRRSQMEEDQAHAEPRFPLCNTGNRSRPTARWLGERKGRNSGRIFEKSSQKVELRLKDTLRPSPPRQGYSLKSFNQALGFQSCLPGAFALRWPNVSGIQELSRL